MGILQKCCIGDQYIRLDLTLHQKIHGNFKCEKCDCEYDVLDLLEKHVSAVHGQMKIFCHYFNNDKECAFEGRCIFAHEESPECKFGQQCERTMCMFVHESRDVSDSEEESDSDETGDDDENENVVKIQDLEPCLERVEEAMKKVQVLLQPPSKLKCDKCEFEAKNVNGLNMHKKAKHTDKSTQSCYNFCIQFLQRALLDVKIRPIYNILRLDSRVAREDRQ